MEKKAYISRRPEIRLKDVKNRYDRCEVDDLFHEAEEGDLTIYFQPSFNCEVGYFASIKQAVLQHQNTQFEKLSDEQKKELIAIYPELKVKYALENGEVMGLQDVEEIAAIAAKVVSDYDKFLKLTPSEFEEEIYAGSNTLYPNKGIYRDVYSQPIVGLFPLSPLSIKDYRLGQNGPVALKVKNNWCDDASKDEEYFITLKPSIHIIDAINGNMLYVTVEDMDRMCGLIPDENLSELFDNPEFPDELKIAITAWQVAQDSKEQGVRPTALITKWLKKMHPNLKKDAITRIVTIANWDKTPGRPKNLDPNR